MWHVAQTRSEISVCPDVRTESNANPGTMLCPQRSISSTHVRTDHHARSPRACVSHSLHACKHDTTPGLCKKMLQYARHWLGSNSLEGAKQDPLAVRSLASCPRPFPRLTPLATSDDLCSLIHKHYNNNISIQASVSAASGCREHSVLHTDVQSKTPQH